MIKEKVGTHKLLIWAPSFVWALVVLFLSVMPCNDLPKLTIKHFDKVIHFVEYLIFALLVMRGLDTHREGISGKQALLFTLIIAGLYGILMELFQLFVPGREPSLGDWVADLGGAVVGMTIGRMKICRK